MTERRFVDTALWRYAHVHKYLVWAKPRLDAVHNGADSPAARQWLGGFRISLHRRISSKALPRNGTHGRKWCDSYLERMSQWRFPRHQSGPCAQCAQYLKRFASRGASCLD